MFTVNGKELDYDIFDADKADLIQRVMEEPSAARRSRSIRISAPLSVLK